MKSQLGVISRILAFFLSLYLVVMVLSGVLLHHASQLKLNDYHVKWDWLMAYYDIGQQKPDEVYLLDNKVISQFGEQVFVDDKPVVKVKSQILGGVTLDAVIVLTTEDKLILLNRNGQYVETMQAKDGVPSAIQNIGLFHGDPVLQTRNGMLRSNYMLDQWEPISLEGVTWSVSYALPDTIKSALQQYFYGEGLSVQKLLTDIHEGKAFGPYGDWITDALGLLLLIYVLAGWMRRRRLQ